MKKLQISLPDFRRLCIFKGIYPREPRNKKKVSKGSTAQTTFYYTKDIQYLLHEPLLAKFREHKSVAKKIGRALGRGEAGDAARLEKNLMPKVKLDHIIKERYPTFIDALRDLDDALSMLFLFANLPSSEHIPAKTIALCQRLTREFEHYIITSHALRKSFLSIKGIYYQATIQGQDILWLVPYRFVQRTGGDIDFRIMGTFVEFYTTLLGFVNYRLYTSVGLVYPPKFNAKSDEQGGELAAFQLEGKANATNGTSDAHNEDTPINPEAQAMADRIAAMPDAEDDEETEMTEAAAVDDDEEQYTEGIDKFEPTAPDADILPQPQASSSEVASLFAPFTFYLSRETPKASLEFILKAFGCKRVGWDSILGDGAFTTNESDPAITHQIVDRPPLTDARAAPEQEDTTAPKAQWPHSMMADRTYIQPQWVWDSLNQGKLLRPDLYAPGAEMPPHLSPWVKPKKGTYDPNLPLEAQQPDDEAEAAAMAEEADEADEDAFEIDNEDDDMDALNDRDGSVEVGEGMDIASDDEDDDEDDDSSDSDADGGADAFDGFEESDAESDVSEGEAARLQHQRELEAEFTGKKVDVKAPTKKEELATLRKKLSKKEQKEKDEHDMRTMMLSRKKRKLLARIEHGANKQDAEAKILRAKRRRLDKEEAAKRI